MLATLTALLLRDPPPVDYGAAGSIAILRIASPVCLAPFASLYSAPAGAMAGRSPGG